MRASFWTVIVSLAACATDVPEGRFTCSSIEDCPDGWFCRDDARCWSTPDVTELDGRAADMDAGSPDDGGDEIDAPGCVPGSCALDEICRDGRCISPMADDDMDGVPAGSDCDDASPAIGTNAERACTGECGVGVEHCVMGTWEACDAPAGTCSPGTTEDTGACGDCGVLRRTCLDTCEWDAPACTSEGECTAGTDETGTMSCGNCGSGMQTRSRSCDSTCAWGAWDSWSSCAGATGCAAGAVDSQSEDCGNCGSGSRTRTRTCSATCGWGSWGSWGACAGSTGCVPAAIATQTDCTSSGNCRRTRVCSSSCAWSSWGSWGSCTGCPGGSTDGESECCNLPKCDSLSIRSRTCSTSTCAWGSWGSWSTCL